MITIESVTRRQEEEDWRFWPDPDDKVLNSKAISPPQAIS